MNKDILHRSWETDHKSRIGERLKRFILLTAFDIFKCNIQSCRFERLKRTSLNGDLKRHYFKQYCFLYSKKSMKVTLFFENTFLFSVTHAMVEKILFLDQIFEMEISMDLHIMRSPESENHIFSSLSVCLLSA